MDPFTNKLTPKNDDKRTPVSKRRSGDQFEDGYVVLDRAKPDDKFQTSRQGLTPIVRDYPVPPYYEDC